MKKRISGEDSYKRFMDGKIRGKYDWEAIKEPFYDSKAGFCTV